VLARHEGGAAFIADAISRTSPRDRAEIGVLVIRARRRHDARDERHRRGLPRRDPAAGHLRRHAHRRGVRLQLHELDQHKILAGITKGSWRC